ncbi:glutathione S-transferase [Exidia glandulosa HHB12029]|uniref:Glutathione S-transferase n=1 Tax=Exidia glandulosa HHB12029 TaxID=1314781 RepID=A0A165GRM5_EXIGL|nr:glutathione S-transferase [Exidia glandulosa HHB12029]
MSYEPCGHNGKQFTLYDYHMGMRGSSGKVLLRILTSIQDFVNKEQKTPAYMKLNQNGKIPTLVDHQRDDFAIWESNAILQYLISEYDTEHKISVADDDKEGKYRTEQWLFFQASGQGPYFGQAQWFMYFHPEHIPSAIKRYQDEIRRVFGVLDNVLKDREWLVGDKFTIADLSFIKYTDYAAEKLLGDDFDLEKEFPYVANWHNRMLARPSVQKVFAYKDARKAEFGDDVTAW